MNGAYYQQQGFGGGAGGFYGGQNAGYSGGQNAGYSGGQNAGYYGGQTAGYLDGQSAGFVGGQTAGFSGSQNASYFGGLSAGSSYAPTASQSVTHSAASYPTGGAAQTDYRLNQSSSSSSGSLVAEGKVQATTASVRVNVVSQQEGDTSVVSVGNSAPVAARRQAQYRRQVIRLPDPPQGPARQVRRRLPTPEPDVLERVYIQRAGPDIIEEITEIPQTPPPRVHEKTVVEPAGPPRVIKRVIRVQGRSAGAASYQQQGGGFVASAGPSVSSFGTGASFSQAQQGVGSYQQAQGAGLGGAGSYGGGFQQQSFGGFQSQAAAPSAGAPNAYCFYV
ncbi:unnamed protein product [Rotaria socialis]|uniref:Uncharacterized protein n=1 Tax=Rotaria socialis TaxID=392032 RepID=A0A820P5Z5_9BILA|nr:unnamed protein product [Rotaria socialis]CAF3526854.1 unnamed protein product [Rotaria socialis]CAF3686984.1 unnamed protein product [Rotaria socialis]CAF3715627.1 unnamed protein product [Rotaria socialis]CAF4123805.1 unnamed protein product [Rotaria socialis]